MPGIERLQVTIFHGLLALFEEIGAAQTIGVRVHGRAKAACLAAFGAVGGILSDSLVSEDCDGDGYCPCQCNERRRHFVVVRDHS